ncbi:MAG: putative iron-sulfur cluster-binding metallochaperone [Pyrinomonadaceae bacterium]
MSDCCSAQAQTHAPALIEGHSSTDTRCTACGNTGRSVERKTVLHHVRHDLLERVKNEAYRFCPDPNCSLVYYSDGGAHFSTDDLRELVTVKASGDKRPLCYCFGLNEGDARDEIARAGNSSIPAQISQLIKAGMCACETRNPAGVCCLGQVNKAVKRLSEEHKTAAESTHAPMHDCCVR